jgi:hypothetical protein
VFANIDGLDVNNEPVDRVETMPAPEDIMDTRTVTRSGYVNTNQVVYSIVLDSGVGDYDFNWVGLIDDEGVLIAATYVPLISKRKSTGGVQGNNLTRNFLIAYSGIQSTTAINVPAETWQIDFTARLDGIDERERLSNFDIYGHEAFLDTGWMVVRQGSTDVYDVLPGVGYVGGIRIASAVAQQVTVASPPASIWVDVSLQGDVSDKSAVVAFIADAVNHDDYTDGNGFEHYLTKLADIDGAGNVIDVRTAASLSEVSADDLAALSAQMTALHNQQAYLTRGILEPFPVFDHVPGCPVPSNDGDAKFIKLSAGEDGVDGYNENLLNNESYTGTAPELSVSATINLVGSPVHGETVELINTSKRYLRPGVSGTTYASQNKAHSHTVPVTTSRWGQGDGIGFGWGNDGQSKSVTPPDTTVDGGSEVTVHTIEATYYARIL